MISRQTAFVALLCLAWIVPGLVGHDPWKPDEAYTFGLVYQLLQGGSWIVPTLAGEPFLGEPPFFHLTAAASAMLFSPPLALHDAARLASGFYIALTFLFCGLASRELNGKASGTIAALLFLGCLGLVIRSHQLISDVASLAGYAIGYYGLALALRRPAAGGLWLGTAIGIVFMTQGLLETGILVVLALLLPALFGAWRRGDYAQSLAIALTAALPWLAIWPILLYAQSPVLFDEWLWSDNIARFLGSGEPAAGLLYYLRILPWYAWPAWALALWALWRARAAGFTRPAIVLPLAGFFVTLILLSAASDARELYALPLLIPLTLLATPAVDTLRRGATNAWYWFSVMGFTFFIVVAWFYWMGLELGVPARLHEHLHHLQPGYTPGFKPLPFILGLVYTLGWFGVLAGIKRSPQRPVIIWATGVTVLWGLLAILFIGWIDTGKSYRSMIVSMQQAMPAQYRCISSRDVSASQRAMLHYMAGIITYRQEAAERRRDCDVLLVQGKPNEENVPLGDWDKIWEGNRPGDREERYRLYHRSAVKAKRR
jgi:4-amino-4-deoxy-L-arabinose transferase-like glycosyltransferase